MHCSSTVASGYRRSSTALRRWVQAPRASAVHSILATFSVRGLMIAGGLMDSGASSAFFTKPGTSLALIFAAIIIMLSYIIITLNYIVTFVESYLVISVGFIFLGFGGSRWTVPYTERFIGLAVAIGVKILLLYCLISAGFQLGVGWMSEATSVGTAPYPAMSAFDVMGGAVIFMMCCWQIPKLFSAVLGGAPALTGGDLVSTGTAIVARHGGGRFISGSGRGLGCGGGRSRRRRSGGWRWFCRFSRWIIQRREWRFFRAIWRRRIGAASISAFAVRWAKKRRFRRLRRPRPSTGPAIICQFGERKRQRLWATLSFGLGRNAAFELERCRRPAHMTMNAGRPPASGSSVASRRRRAVGQVGLRG